MEADELEGDRGGRLGTVLGILAAVLFFGLVAWGIYHFANQSGPPKKPGPQQVAILKQPPPPPPKPPEKPPEPPKIKEEVKVDEPKAEPPKPTEQPPDNKPASDKPLGVDADAQAGSDGFGLAANRGGRDLLTLGTGTGSSGTGRYFTGLLQRNFFEALARNRKMPQGEFSVVVSLLLGDDGRVQRAEIVNGSGNSEIDTLIQATLTEMPPLREVPPANLRQVQLRLNRRA